MKDTNVVIICGRLTRDAEVKYTGTGTAILKFSLAFSSSKKEGDRWVDVPNYVECTQIGKAAEAVSKFLVKGKQVIVNGALEYQSWESDGQKRSKVAVFANFVQLIGSKETQQPGHEPVRYGATPEPKSDLFSGDDFEDDRLPF